MSTKNILTEVFQSVAGSYHAYFSSKGYPITLEECYAVLELPVPSGPVVSTGGTSAFKAVSSATPGMPGLGPSGPSGPETKKTNRRGGRKKADTSVNPHLNLGPASRPVKEGMAPIVVGPPVDGYCNYTITKGARVGRYCIEKVDASKPGSRYCKRCAGKGQATANAGGMAPSTSNFSAGFHSSIPNPGESVSLNTSPYGDSGFHTVNDTDLIVRLTETPGEMLVCGWLDEGNINFDLKSKYDQIRRLKLKIVDTSGKVYEPPAPPQGSASAGPSPFHIQQPSFNPTQNIPGFGSQSSAPTFNPTQNIPGFGSQSSAPTFNPTQNIPGFGGSPSTVPKLNASGSSPSTSTIPGLGGSPIPGLSPAPKMSGSSTPGVPNIPGFNMSAFTPTTVPPSGPPSGSGDEDDEYSEDEE